MNHQPDLTLIAPQPPAGTLVCIECSGLAIVVRNEMAIPCPECEGLGFFTDVDAI